MWRHIPQQWLCSSSSSSNEPSSQCRSLSRRRQLLQCFSRRPRVNAAFVNISLCAATDFSILLLDPWIITLITVQYVAGWQKGHRPIYSWPLWTNAVTIWLTIWGASWRTGDPWCYGWGRQLLGCCRPCGGTTSIPKGARRTPVGTRLSRYLWAPWC